MCIVATRKSFGRWEEEVNGNANVDVEFESDYERITSSKAFRRLGMKTQIFIIYESDHNRTRLTHTLEVMSIAQVICRRLSLNETLATAIALGHDIGHPPFGHAAERKLHLLASGKHSRFSDIPILNIGGFKHNWQGLRIVDDLSRYTNKLSGLNLTYEVREGILKHTRLQSKVNPKKITYIPPEMEAGKKRVKYEKLFLSTTHCSTLEGQVVAIADEIAQCLHDLDDGIRSDMIKLEDVKEDKLIKEVIGNEGIPTSATDRLLFTNLLLRMLKEKLIKHLVEFSDTLITNWINMQHITSNEDFHDKRKLLPELIRFASVEPSNLEQEQNIGNNFAKHFADTKTIVKRSVINTLRVNRMDGHAEDIMEGLLACFLRNPSVLSDFTLERFRKAKESVSLRNPSLSEDEVSELKDEMRTSKLFRRMIFDHLAGMTDAFAEREFRQLML